MRNSNKEGQRERKKKGDAAKETEEKKEGRKKERICNE